MYIGVSLTQALLVREHVGDNKKHRHAKRAGVIFSINWVAWGRTGC